MKKYDVKNKLEAFTVAFYNEMVNNDKKGEFYRIAYYLYFLKKRDYFVFDNDYVKTRTGIIWPDNEELMFHLIFNQSDERKNIDCELLNQVDEKLVSEVYEKYKLNSLTKLKEMVLDDIKSMELFTDSSLQEQMAIVLKRFQKLYEKNDLEALNLLKTMFLKHNISEFSLEKGNQKIIIPKKKVI